MQLFTRCLPCIPCLRRAARAAACLFVLLASGQVMATDYYVSATGSDAADGKSLTTPFLTIQKAADVAVSGDVVHVRAGTYREMVDIKNNGVTFQPYANEKVTISGTELLTAWTLTAGSTYQAPTPWVLDRAWGSHQMFVNGKMLELARWPDQTSADIVMPTNARADNVAPSGNFAVISDADFNEPATRWIGAKVWVNLSRDGYDGQGWTGTVVGAIAGKITVDFGEVIRLGEQAWSFGPGTEYYLFDPNSDGVKASGGPDALLSKGEWWRDSTAATGTVVYVKTPDGAAPGTAANVVEAKRRHFGFWSSATRSGYTIKGFNLFACSITTDRNATKNRIIVEGAQNITIDGITARYHSHQTDMTGNWQDQHYGWSGIVLSGRNNTIRNCDLQFSATSALSVSGFNNKVLNNVIANTNYMCSNSGAMNTGFVLKDSEIAYNTIRNTTVIGINFRNSQNSDINVRDRFRIHHNTIYDFMRRGGDSGAIDMAAQDGQWIRIDHNLIYNTTPVVSWMVHGIYLDFGGGTGVNEGHYTLDHNVIYNVPAPILLNSLQDVNIFNNVLIGSDNDRPIEGSAIGTRVKIYNNIMSRPLFIRPDNLKDADIKNNLFDVAGPRLNSFFVNAAGGDFRLIPTAAEAINKGISVAPYDVNVVGAPDLGAFELTPNADTQAPSVPAGLAASKNTPFQFDLSWTPATDNVAVSYYEIFRDGAYYGSSPTNTFTVRGLVPATSYAMTVRARDAAGKASGTSTPLAVTTVADTNIAPRGTAFRWARNALLAPNRIAAPGLNDRNLTAEVHLNGGADDNEGAFEAAGVIWEAPIDTIKSINFIQGDVDARGNSAFTEALSLEFSPNGTDWISSWWEMLPRYTYGNDGTAKKTFVFHGPPAAGMKGFRLIGRVNSTDSSRAAILREVRMYGVATGPNAVEDELAAGQVTLYPNPAAHGWFKVEVGPALARQKVTVAVTDMAGRTLLRKVADGGGHALDIRHLAPGLYAVRVSARTGARTLRLVVAR